jgi:hypothetical protein
MSGPLYQVGALATCPHGGQVMAASKDLRVLATGMVTLASDQFTVVGCAFSTPAGPQPCVRVQWMGPFTTRCTFMTQPAVTAGTIGMCLAANGAPNGPVVVAGTQMRVVAM